MIRVFDMTGKIVNTDNVMLNSGSQYQIDLTNYSNGFYTIQFISPTKTGALRVVKK
jgi:hypothetical protein